MHPTELETGERFGRLVVTGPVVAGRITSWKATCDCGSVVEISRSDLLRGKVRSCGCLRRQLLRERNAKTVKHGRATQANNGGSADLTYKSWNGMHERCANPSRSYYAGRGIVVCERWSSFANFL